MSDGIDVANLSHFFAEKLDKVRRYIQDAQAPVFSGYWSISLSVQGCVHDSSDQEARSGRR